MSGSRQGLLVPPEAIDARRSTGGASAGRSTTELVRSTTEPAALGADGGPVQAAFAALEAKDLDAFLALLTDDAVLVDPHYPQERMVGKAAITDGMVWMFRTMEALRFEVLDSFASTDETRLAVELVARHIGPGHRAVEIPQLFVIDLEGGRLARIRAYQPYGPSGTIGLFLFLVRLMRGVAARLAGAFPRAR